MVRTIKIKPAKEATKRCVCKNCGATLEFVQRDVKRYDGTDISGGPDGHEWIDCPNCSGRVILRSW